MTADLEDLDRRLAAVYDGTAPPSSIDEWWKANAETYRKPEHPGAEWYIAVEDLHDQIQPWLQAAIADPPTSGGLTLLLALLPRLHECGMHAAGPLWFLGSRLHNQSRYGEAAPVLQLLVEECPPSGQDADLACNALDLLVQCHRELGRLDLARNALEELRQRAELIDDDRFRAAALRHQAILLHSRAAGGEDPVPLAQQALALRRHAAEPEASPARSVGAFFATLGSIARDRGQLDLALRTYTAWAEEAADTDEKARARSEIGFTHWRAQRPDLAAAELEEAARLAGPDDERLAGRWRLLASAFRGETAGIADMPASQQIRTASDAYHEASLAEVLASQGSPDAARATAVLGWAEAHRDADLQLGMHQVLAVAARRAEDHKAARRHLRLAIDLADRRNRELPALALRIQLAGVYSDLDQPQFAYETLLSGLALAEVARDAAASSEEGQQLAAVAAGLYEYLAAFAAAGGLPEVVVSASELLRARNLVRWLILDEAARTSAVASAALRDWRATEVEAEVRHMEGSLAGAVLVELDQRRRAAVEAMTSAGINVSPSLWTRTLPEAAEVLDGVATDDHCIVCFLASESGIAAAVIPSGARPDEVHALNLPWPAEERRATVGAWLAAARGVARSRGRDSVGEMPLDPSLLESVINDIRRCVAEPLTDFLTQSTASTLVVVPHRELAAVPLWALVEPPLPSRAITVVPSLLVWRHLARRGRRAGDRLVVVGDATGTLDQVPVELAAIQEAIKLQAVQPATYAGLFGAAASAQVLHVAGHGRYDEAVPLRSGLILEKVSHAAAPPGPFAALAEYGSDQFRMVTTAEIMTEADLGACRLAVLSACESGVSRQHPAAELTGLPTSLLLAGCEQVVASSWRIDDAAAAATAILLYRGLAELGSAGDAAAALGSARRELMSLSRAAAVDLLGEDAALPSGEYPFSHPTYADAFSCYGVPRLSAR
jgi:CHAT domain-containing protein